MGAVLGFLVAAVLIASVVAFMWGQLNVLRARRYPRQQPKSAPPPAQAEPEHLLRAVPDEPQP